MPRAFSGAYSADGKRIAYEEIATVMFPAWFEASGWRHYRGGRTHPIRVMNLADNSVTKLPWTDSNDAYPMWIGNTVYFLSDRNFTTNLFSLQRGHEGAEAAHAPQRLRHRECVGRTRRDRLRAGRLHASARREDRDSRGSSASTSPATFPGHALAVQAGRKHDPELVAVADRRARRHRGAR